VFQLSPLQRQVRYVRYVRYVRQLGSCCEHHPCSDPLDLGNCKLGNKRQKVQSNLPCPYKSCQKSQAQAATNSVSWHAGFIILLQQDMTCALIVPRALLRNSLVSSYFIFLFIAISWIPLVFVLILLKEFNNSFWIIFYNTVCSD
jgi:hypothetical protein